MGKEHIGACMWEAVGEIKTSILETLILKYLLDILMDLGVSSDVRGEIWVLSSLQQLTSSFLQFSSSPFGFDGTNLFWSFSYLLHFFLPSLKVGIP